MMINKVTLLGRLAKDPEVKTFADGGALANLRLITSRYWKDKNGQQQEQVQGHNVVIRIPTIAKKMESMLAKGHLLYVEGSLETRKWQDQNGQNRYSTEVVVRPFNGTIRRMPTSVQPTEQTAHPSAETPLESQETPPSQTEDQTQDNISDKDIDTPFDFMADLDDAFSNDF